MLIIIFLALFALIMIEIITKQQKKQDKHPYATITRQPQSLSAIFVVLPMYRPRNPMSCVKRLFENAAFPERIHVGILEHNSADAPSIADTTAYHFKYKRNSESSELFGAGFARQWIVDNFYDGERYILFIGQNSQMSKDWDTILIESLECTHVIGGHIVSQFPCVATLDRLPSTFPVFKNFKKNIPVFKGRFVVGEYRQPQPSALASWQCLFGTAAVLKNALAIHENSLPFLNSTEADWLLSSEIWSQGFRVFIPSESAVALAEKSRRHSFDATLLHHRKLKQFTVDALDAIFAQKKHNSLYCLKLHTRQTYTVKDFMKWLRVNPAKCQIAGQTMMGLMPEYTQNEIMWKYGSLQRFKELKKTISDD